MSIHHALLALLSARPSTTYQLRKDFDEVTGHVRPLNIGQASATLSRLERDGLVVRSPEEGGESTAGLWSLTEKGRSDLVQWWAAAVDRTLPDRQELVMKLALAVTVPGVDVAGVVQEQRTATLAALQDVTRARRHLGEEDLSALLVLEHHLFSLEAELRWLDDIEGTLDRVAARHRAAPRPDAAPLKPSAVTRSTASTPLWSRR